MEEETFELSIEDIREAIEDLIQKIELSSFQPETMQ